MNEIPTQNEIQSQLNRLSQIVDKAARATRWLKKEWLQQDPIAWRAKRLELELLLLNKGVSDLGQQIQHRQEVNRSEVD